MRRSIQRGIAAEDGELEGREARTRLDPQLVREPLPRGAEHRERFGLPIGAVISQGDDRPPVLTQRLFAEQALGVRDE